VAGANGDHKPGGEQPPVTHTPEDILVHKTRLAGLVSLAAAVTLGTAACGSSSKSTGSGSPSAASTTPAVTVAKLTGKQTAVTLNTDTVKFLKGIGVSVAPEGKAALTMLPDGAAVAFPITGGNVKVFAKGAVDPYVQGELDHRGSGLTFSSAKTKVTVTDFVVDPGKSMLIATLADKSTPLFLLDGSALTIAPGGGGYMLDGTVVKLLPGAARALETAFGAPPKTIPDFAPIGVAHIIATG